MKVSRRWLMLQLLLLTACSDKKAGSKALLGDRLSIGVVSYDRGEEAIARYAEFKNYLEEKTGALVELEPAFNENKALERIESKAWSLVFAPPGLAAIAMSQYQYQPLFPLQGVNNLRSLLVVRKDSPIVTIKQLQDQTVALGQPGSATGYYWPIYNLYGLTLAEIVFAPTPKVVLESVAQRQVAVGAISEEEFNFYKSQFSQTEFRVLYTDPHNVPAGAVLISPQQDRDRQEKIRQVMSETPAILAQQVGYIPNGPIPDYHYMISVVERVRSISTKIRQKPVRLF